MFVKEKLTSDGLFLVLVHSVGAKGKKELFLFL